MELSAAHFLLFSRVSPALSYIASGLLVFFASGYVHQKNFDGPTAVSRLDLLHALVTGTVHIDAYHTDTPDKAAFDGHYYSDKAPGAVFLALPSFAASVLALYAAGVTVDCEKGWLVSSWVSCLCSNGLIAAFGAAALFAWLLRHVPTRFAFLTMVALFLGAAPLPYATMMFSHSLVVGCIAIAIWALDREPALSIFFAGHERTVGPLRRFGTAHKWDLLAGFACGWALASEYTAGLIIVSIFFSLVWPGWRRIVAFGMAAIPPLLLIPAYSYACFGDPFILPYSRQASFPEMKEGVFGIKWPDLETAFKLLFSPTRGLFFWSPFLIMAGFGYGELFRRSPRMFWLMYLVPLLQILVISGRVWDWESGPALGPRLLSPMLPLLALPCALGIRRWPRLGTALASYSIAITTLATLTDACPPASIYNPMIELHIPLFLKGQFSPNLGMLFGLHPYVSVALYYAILIGGVWWLWRKLPAGEDSQQERPMPDNSHDAVH
jgi:hypothetical protein